MLISQAFAASEAAAPAAAPAADTAAPAAAAAAAVAAAPSGGDAFMTNMGLILVMFVLFYMLIIRPQQKRLKAQQAMLGALKVGDKVVTGAGFVGTISKLISDTEVEVDLGNNFKVTALRYTITAMVNSDTQKAA